MGVWLYILFRACRIFSTKHLPMTMGRTTISQRYRALEVRLKTFDNWPGVQTPDSLARCGFYYTDDGDMVKCFSCGIRIYDWDPSDEPLAEHIRLSSNCAHAQYCAYQDKVVRYANEFRLRVQQEEQGKLDDTPTNAEVEQEAMASKLQDSSFDTEEEWVKLFQAFNDNVDFLKVLHFSRSPTTRAMEEIVWKKELHDFHTDCLLIKSLISALTKND